MSKYCHIFFTYGFADIRSAIPSKYNEESSDISNRYSVLSTSMDQTFPLTNDNAIGFLMTQLWEEHLLVSLS